MSFNPWKEVEAVVTRFPEGITTQEITTALALRDVTVPSIRRTLDAMLKNGEVGRTVVNEGLEFLWMPRVQRNSAPAALVSIIEGNPGLKQKQLAEKLSAAVGLAIQDALGAVMVLTMRMVRRGEVFRDSGGGWRLHATAVGSMVDMRIGWARSVARHIYECELGRPPPEGEPLDGMMVDTIVNLHHLADAEHIDWADIEVRAVEHYDEEVEGKKA